MVISWLNSVNRRILDQTQINIGEGGFVEDKSSNGEFKERRLTSLAVPDTFNVVMDFDWLVKDQNGMSEFDRFVYWYKYTHKRGVNPFWFDSITRFGVNTSIEDTTGLGNGKCQYKITSGLKPQKSGFSYRVTMTWEEVYSGPGIKLDISDTISLDHVNLENGHAYFYMSNVPVEPLNPSDFKLERKNVEYSSEEPWVTIPITSTEVDGDLFNAYFTPITNANYFVKLSYKDQSLYETLGVK